MVNISGLWKRGNNTLGDIVDLYRYTFIEKYHTEKRRRQLWVSIRGRAQVYGFNRFPPNMRASESGNNQSVMRELDPNTTFYARYNRLLTRYYGEARLDSFQLIDVLLNLATMILYDEHDAVRRYEIRRLGRMPTREYYEPYLGMLYTVVERAHHVLFYLARNEPQNPDFCRDDLERMRRDVDDLVRGQGNLPVSQNFMQIIAYDKSLASPCTEPPALPHAYNLDPTTYNAYRDPVLHFTNEPSEPLYFTPEEIEYAGIPDDFQFCSDHLDDLAWLREYDEWKEREQLRAQASRP